MCGDHPEAGCCYHRIVAAGARDLSLAEELLAGKPGAFERFVETYRQKIFQYTLLMCGQREDAEEVAQETLLKVFEKVGQLREPAHLKAWVFRIARNACFMRRRKSAFAPAEELSLDELMPRFSDDGNVRRLEIADWSAVPEELAINSQLGAMLRKAIEELPEIYRAVILLRDVEELSTEETAGVLDVSEDAVKTRLHRARLAVRQSLDRYLRGEERAQ
jgi:RNA polymerase sigma-70 factor (ECF subfamily)